MVYKQIYPEEDSPIIELTQSKNGKTHYAYLRALERARELSRQQKVERLSVRTWLEHFSSRGESAWRFAPKLGISHNCARRWMAVCGIDYEKKDSAATWRELYCSKRYPERKG